MLYLVFVHGSLVLATGSEEEALWAVKEEADENDPGAAPLVLALEARRVSLPERGGAPPAQSQR